MFKIFKTVKGKKRSSQEYARAFTKAFGKRTILKKEDVLFENMTFEKELTK